jgi:hypothetical protein
MACHWNLLLGMGPARQRLNLLSSIDWLAYDPEAMLYVFVLPKFAEHDCIGALNSEMLESNVFVLW